MSGFGAEAGDIRPGISRPHSVTGHSANPASQKTATGPNVLFWSAKERFGAMGKHSQFPTQIQNIALELIFAVMGEERINRTYDEYMAIAKRLPALKVLTSEINRMRQQAHRSNDECNGFVLPQLCRFKAGDQRIIYEPYPKTISYETVRTALENGSRAG